MHIKDYRVLHKLKLGSGLITMIHGPNLVLHVPENKVLLENSHRHSLPLHVVYTCFDGSKVRN